MSPALAFVEQFQPASVWAAAAREAERVLSHLAKQDGPVQVQSRELNGGRPETALLPRAAVGLDGTGSGGQCQRN